MPDVKALDVIRKARILEFLAAPLAEKVAQAAQVRELPDGTTLMKAGDASDSLYVIVEGRVRVDVDFWGEGRKVAELGPGAIVGEVAALWGEARTATVTSLSPLVLLEVPGAIIREVAAADPAFRKRLEEMINKHVDIDTGLAGG